MIQHLPYQIEGAEWLADNANAMLADEAGLGKTGQAIRAAKLVKAKRPVVIAPAVAVTHWLREFEMWWPGGPKPIVVSYDMMAKHRKIRDELKALQPDVLIADEAQYLKSRDSRRTRAFYGPYCKNDGLAGKAARVWLLSATPAPNDGSEYWPHLRALWPALISRQNFVEFVQHYFTFDNTRYGLRVLGNKRPEELRAILRKVALRRMVFNVLPQLPAWNWEAMTADPVEAINAIRRMEAEDPAVAALHAALDNDESFEASVHTATLRRLIGEAKAPAIAGSVSQDLRYGQLNKVVIFAQHHSVLNLLHAHLGNAGFNPVQLTGLSSTQQRQAAIDRFQTDPTCRVFLGQNKAAGTVITLTAANHVELVEPSWVPDDNYQMAKRVHRIGQKLPVFVRVWGLAGSIDDKISRTCVRKSRNARELNFEQEKAA